MTAVLLAPALPLFAVAVIVGLRRPLILVALYAFLVPWGSGYALSVGLPPAFSSLSTLAGLATSVGLLAHLVATRSRAATFQPSTGIALALLGSVMLTVVWSVDRRLTIDELLVLASLVFLYVVVTFVRTRPRDLAIVEVALIAGGCVVGLLAIARLLTGTMPTTGAGVPRFEVLGGGGENGDPNITAAMLLLPLFVALGRGLAARRLMVRGTYIVAAGTIGAAVVLTVSRGGLVGFAVGALVLAVMRGGWRLAAALVTTALLFGAVLLSLAPTEMRDHLFVPGSSGRSGVWAVGMKACADHCAVGTGWGTFPEIHEQVLLDTPEASGTRLRFAAHNIWLQAGVEAGATTLLLLVGLFAATAYTLWRLPPEVRGPPLAALAALAVTNTFLSNMDFKYFWLVFMHASLVVVAYGPRVPTVVVAQRQPAWVA